MESAPLQLGLLLQRLRAVEERWRPEQRAEPARVRSVAGSLRRQCLHEWLGVQEAGSAGEAAASGKREKRTHKEWTPALAVPVDAAVRAWRDSGGMVVWIGSAVWPYAASLPVEVAADSMLLHPAPQERLWAIDLVLRCPAVTAVVADGSGLSLRATRRLQLAAEAGRALAMLTRPEHEIAQRSAAAYRWVVRTAPVEKSPIDRRQAVRPRWEVELVRSKAAGADPGAMSDGGTGVTWSRQATRCVVEWRHEGLVVVHAVVGDRADQAKPGTAEAARSQQLRRRA